MKWSISRKLIIALVIFVLVLSTSICVIVSYYFGDKIEDKYEYVGSSISQFLADRIDGDRAIAYLDSHQPDDYYDEILDTIDDIEDTFKPLYVYVAIPTEDKVLYLWSNGFSGEETIGFTTDYAYGGKEWMESTMAGTEENALIYVEDPNFGLIATAATPIYDHNGNPVALALVDFAVEEIADAIFSIIIKIIIIVTAMMLIFLVVYFTYVERLLVAPIGKLTKSAKVLTSNLDREKDAYVSDIKTGDELQDLSEAFEKMDGELRDYINENMRITAEKERIGAELDMAASIQSSQLPSVFPAFPERKDFDIYASMDPAKEVGGDFYDFFLVDEDRIAMVMADVSGKGIPASLFMMISKMLIQSRVMMGESPAEALTNTNAQLMQNNAAKQFVTVWLAVFNLRTGKGIAANAGHEHPAIRRAGGQYELSIYRHSPPVATMKKLKFKEHEFEMAPGDSLFVYTDGVAEATNANEELYGTDRMLEALNKDPGADPETILKNVRESVDAFVAGAEQFDDLTMMSFYYKGPDAG